MNIFMVDYEYPPVGGGGGVFNKQLAESLVSRGHRVCVLTSRYGSLPSCSSENGVDIHRVPVAGRSDRNAASIVSMLSFLPASIRRGQQLMNETMFDLVHSFFAIPSAPSGVMLARRSGLPHVLSILGGDIYDPTKNLSPHRTPVLRQAVKWVLRNSDQIVSLSADIKGRAETYYDIAGDCIDQVFLGIPEPNFPTLKRGDYGIEEDAKVIITIGRLVPRKALHELIKAVAELGEKSVRLLIVGDGPERSNLEQCATREYISDQVLFAGNVDDDEKFGLLKMADIYASTSTHEGFGIVFLEAMAAGLPVVCYDNGGQAEYLRDTVTGFVVPLGDRDGIVNGIITLLDDADTAAAIRHHNLEYIRSFFIDECTRQYETVYQRVKENK